MNDNKEQKIQLDTRVAQGVASGNLALIPLGLVHELVSTLLKRSSLVSDLDAQKLADRLVNAANDSKDNLINQG